ncbi:MAG: pgl [Myxococcales bacterium]|nr:pgl [Myxococcales bacterium]
MTAQIRTYEGLDDLSRAAADELTAIAKAAVAARGSCSIALSGGSTPKRLFQLLAAQGRGALPWDQIDLWWGDERTVPPDHPDSNYRMTREALIDPLQLSPTRVHRIPAELPDHDAAATAYERELVAALGSPPVFDLVLLGMGPDGHTASLFPGSPALREAKRFVVANPVDSPVAKGKTTRITLTAPALNAARHVRFLVAGADKADSLEQVLEGPPNPIKYPSQLIVNGDVAWLVDRAAAARLRGNP